MLKRVLLFLTITACSLCIKAQSNTLSSAVRPWLEHTKATLLEAAKLKNWRIPAGNYSGITPLGNFRYAVVTDKPKCNGFYEFEIKLNAKGEVILAENLGFRSDSIHTKPRDMEGIVYVSESNTVFISAESDQEILEYTLTGQQTGRKLNVPEGFSIKNIQPNYGFEPLGYSHATGFFWTTSENTLRADKTKQNPYISKGAACLRLQSFTSDLEPHHQFAYKTDAPLKLNPSCKAYCFGVPAITALPDGSLLIIEREVFVAKRIMGSFVNTKIYRVHPNPEKIITFDDSFENIPAEKFLKKTLVTQFRCSLRKMANYEGMCLGPALPDGTQTLFLVCDSQDNVGNLFYHLRDRIRVILLK